VHFHCLQCVRCLHAAFRPKSLRMLWLPEPREQHQGVALRGTGDANTEVWVIYTSNTQVQGWCDVGLRLQRGKMNLRYDNVK
jgi:hypothetical protein